MLDVYKGIFSYASVNLWTMYIFRSFWTMPNFRNEEGVEWNKASNQNEHFNYLKKKEKDKLRSIIFCFFLFSISTLWDRFYNEPTASSSSQSSLILFFSITFCFVFLWKSRLAFYVEGWRFVVCPRARARSPSNTQKEKHWIGWMDFFILLVTARFLSVNGHRVVYTIENKKMGMNDYQLRRILYVSYFINNFHQIIQLIYNSNPRRLLNVDFKSQLKSNAQWSSYCPTVLIIHLFFVYNVNVEFILAVFTCIDINVSRWRQAKQKN